MPLTALPPVRKPLPWPYRITRQQEALLSGGLHPHYRQVTQTWGRSLGFRITARPPDPIGVEDLIGRVDMETACAVVQNPSFFGLLKDHTALAAACHKAGALLVVAVTESVSLLVQ